MRPPRDKVLGRDELVLHLQELRSSGARVVFTNGCFDLLHAGHVETLLRARCEGDALVVGLNSDASVRRLKGPRRPLTREEDRAFLVAALECVDYVVVFPEDTPIETIRQLRPDVHVKGGDYRPEDLPEGEVVRSYGGRVVIAPVIPGLSTTRLERALREDG
ncbi:MAG: D-glycero-beta-D-manno-heptose 1-phosphate adenylyltransferase [Armatimonadetes bacterium]|nr:D-glycero-beta-D-manno-heptose 1-phosphate adenylyltransferase [Armatimonadota bacterium]